MWFECWGNIAVFHGSVNVHRIAVWRNVSERNSTHDFLIKNERLENKGVVFDVSIL